MPFHSSPPSLPLGLVPWDPSLLRWACKIHSLFGVALCASCLTVGAIVNGQCCWHQAHDVCLANPLCHQSHVQLSGWNVIKSMPSSEPLNTAAPDMNMHPCDLTKPVAVMQMTKNPFTSQLLNASELMRGLSPAMVRQVLPLLDQLTPIYTDLAQGRLEFTPEPEETKRLIRTFYGKLCCR